MSEDTPFIIETNDDVEKRTGHRRFPVLAQLAVLVLILGGLLGSVILPAIFSPNSKNQKTATAVATEPNQVAFVVETITPPALEAKAVYVYDVVANRALYSKNADEVLPLASIAKLMTALVAHETMADDTKITVPKAATTQTSASGLAWGEIFNQRELRDYAMLASSNDAAYSLAVGGGNIIVPEAGIDAFVAAMNVTAEELNLASLQFKNPTGLDISPTEAGAYGSARDVSFLMNYILRTYPDILAPTTIAYERIHNTAGVYHEAENTNPDINAIPNLLGSKTGYTDLAAGNLTIAFDAGYNRPVIITVLGSSYDGRFRDVVALTKAVQAAFKSASSDS